jgi:hypothetical protein
VEAWNKAVGALSSDIAAAVASLGAAPD